MTRVSVFPRSVPFAGFVFVLFLCASCGPSSSVYDDRIEQDLGFGYDDLKKGSLLVAGISATPGYFGAQERARLGGTLANLLLAALHGAPGLHIIGPGTVVQRLGLDSYDDMMRGIDEEGGLSRQYLPVLDSVAPDIRHVLVAYVTNENVMDFADEHYSEDGEEVTTDYEKRFYLTVDFQLYDIRYEKMVFSHIVHNEAMRSESRTTSTGCVEGCMQSVLQNLLFGTPAELNREEVLSEMVERFAERLRTTRPRTRLP